MAICSAISVSESKSAADFQIGNTKACAAASGTLESSVKAVRKEPGSAAMDSAVALTPR